MFFVNNLKEILVRYGEIGIKSTAVRRLMEKQLAFNVHLLLEKLDIKNFQVKVKKGWGRILVLFDDHKKNITEIAQSLADYVFGITSVSPATRISSEFEIIKKEVLSFVSERIPSNCSFVVRARRVGKHPYTSLELERLVGEVIYENLADEKNLSVDLKEPDYTLYIEVRDELAFIFDQRIEGFGGFPQGLQGSLGSILRGSMEDAVAGFLMCKRGSITTPVLFTKKSTERESNLEALNYHLEQYSLFQSASKQKYIVVDFDAILEKIGLNNIHCALCDKICIGIIEQILGDKIKDGITLGNSSDAILYRNPEESSKENFIPIYYPLIAFTPQMVKHPFTSNENSAFCLHSCPGFKNQKKKEKKPLSKKEIQDIVANADFSIHDL